MPALEGPSHSLIIVGIGNDLLQDDAVGIEAVRRLKGTVPADCVECSTAGLALLDVLVGYSGAILVDSVQMEADHAGRVREWDPDHFQACGPASPHFMGLGEVRDLARVLDLPFPASLAVITVAIGNCMTIGQPLSKPVLDALPELVARIREKVNTWQSGDRPASAKRAVHRHPQAELKHEGEL